ncbi:MAG: S8 family serine peptidase [Phycisphaeraceae bacterium]|nr:S8 family serine peptidase [Phycisphaeraceae bacterium]
MNRRFRLASYGLTACIAASAAHAQHLGLQDGELDLGHVADELIIGFDDVPTAESIEAISGLVEVTGWKETRHPTWAKHDRSAPHPLAKVRIAKLSDGVDVVELAQRVAQIPGVRYAEPNGHTMIALVPNDPRYNQQYGPKIAKFEGAWDITTGSRNIVIAVADTGISWTHEDLAGIYWVNPGEIAGNGIDDDGNGFVDDWRGWNFINNNNNPQDGHSHGTHVSGTIAAGLNNGIGVAGMANVTIMPLQVFSAGGGGTWEAIAYAIYYAVDNGAHALNYSGGGGGGAQVLADACKYADQNGMPVIAAAGNNNSQSPFYPAYYPEAIAIGATNASDNRAGFSNYGNWIDVVAPGEDIVSTVHWTNSSYEFYSGTSMAAPHVSGLVALMYTKNPGLSGAEVRQLLRSNADDLGAPGFDIQFGWGRINALKTLQNTPAACYADCNGDTVLNTQDLLCFLNLYTSGNAKADCNGDTVINTQDVLCFLNLYTAGCN